MIFLKTFFLFLFISTSAWAQGSFGLFQKGISYSAVPKARDIYVYLPPGYNKARNHYPVLYIHDGQNLFDPERAFLGQTWNAEKTLNELIQKKLIKPLIVVAIDNTAARMDEYVPERGAKEYLEFLVREVKPRVDRSFRTKSEAEFTGILGSSLGGLVSLYAGVIMPHHFGLVGALSPSIWWNERSMLERVRVSEKLPQKIYLDSGTVGGEKPQDVIDLSSLLESRGFRHRDDLLVYIQEGADHREAFWSERFPVALKFFFPYL